MNVVEMIKTCAAIPSFSTMEYYLHPFIEEKTRMIRGSTIEYVPDNNLLIFIPGKRDIRPVALTAHLDKINHFGQPIPEQLPVRVKGDKITGQLDDATGVGICLFMAFLSVNRKFPPLYLLFSEMEEYGPYDIPGMGRIPSGIGAFRLAHHLINTKKLPALAITIDTTPTFKGMSGVALYSRFWELCGIIPSQSLIKATEYVEKMIHSLDPDVRFENNTNDYITYGKLFNTAGRDPLPSIALEPAIFHCHTKGEEVFLTDIEKVTTLLTNLLEQFSGFPPLSDQP